MGMNEIEKGMDFGKIWYFRLPTSMGDFWGPVKPLMLIVCRFFFTNLHYAMFNTANCICIAMRTAHVGHFNPNFMLT